MPRAVKKPSLNEEQDEPPTSPDPLAKLTQHPSIVRCSFLLLLVLFLIVGDIICYQFSLPIELDEVRGTTRLRVGSENLMLGSIGIPVSLQLVPHDPVVHEYQIDGTDSTNNHTLDLNYLHHIASTPYYRFQVWMRNLDGTSRWSDLQIYGSGRQLVSQDWPKNGTQIALPPDNIHIYTALRRPETPMSIRLFTRDDRIIQITVNRNDRKIEVTSQAGDGQRSEIASAFFPDDALPFAAMILDTLIRTMLCAIVVLLLITLCEIPAAFLQHSSRRVFQRLISQKKPQSKIVERSSPPGTAGKQYTNALTWIAAFLRGQWSALNDALHPIALIALLASFSFVSWIAIVQYHGEPHIYDASAYVFTAKMYAQGHLAVPIPPAIDRFPGPFMVQFADQWFGQYPPGTALTLVPGIWLGIPWLVEPVLGTLALLGCGLLAARFYDKQVATLTIILGASSPFYSYLAASYLSHTITLFYLVWGILFFVRFLQRGATWNVAVAAVLFGMAALTRQQVSVFYACTALLGILLVSWQEIRQDWYRWSIPASIFLLIALAFLGITLTFNALLTHDPLLSPRLLFFNGDHWGFGQHVGFYGQHTIAAGLVNLDELLTLLCIDLYGWPSYLSLAWITLPFLLRKALKWDWLFLILTSIFMAAYIGYFYHGIYLGPRYFFETLPFLLMLTSRGILVLAHAGNEIKSKLLARWQSDSIIRPARKSINVPVVLLLSALFLCNLIYFLPRQIALHRDFSGMPSQYHLKLSEIYHAPLHNAIVVTNDYMVYQLVLFPLNDPYLQGDIVYAWGSNAADYQELRRVYPRRVLVRLDIAADGSVEYIPLTQENAGVTK
jgi:hypothetical protein